MEWSVRTIERIVWNSQHQGSRALATAFMNNSDFKENPKD